MTRQEHEALQKLFNTISDCENERDEAFKDLQWMSNSCGGEMWCNAERNLREIQKLGSRELIYRAEERNRIYHEMSGRIEALRDLGRTLAELDFWKEART